jgi:hypothetical protein
MIFLNLPIDQAIGIILGKKKGVEGMDPLAGSRSGGITCPFEPGVGVGMEDVIPTKPTLVDDSFVVRLHPSETAENDTH